MQKPFDTTACGPFSKPALSSGFTSDDQQLEVQSAVKEHEWLFQQHGIRVVYASYRQWYKSSAGTILQRCLLEVDRFRDKMSKALCVYKIGMTSNPIVRFSFYKDKNYTHMSLLHVTTNIGVAQMLEASVIAWHKSQPGCRNERSGGEGPPTDKEPYHFVYVVGARADTFKAIG